MTEQLTQADVAHLLSDPSVDARAGAAAKIAGQFDAGSLNATERGLAEEIFRVMMRDAALRVREALSQNLKACAFLPHDVARTLAQDVAAVSVPVLEASEVLTDTDLIEIIQSQGTEKQLAISRRNRVSEKISDALVETGEATVVASLVRNTGAAISEKTLHKVVDGFGEDASIQGPVVHRMQLPVSVSERLVALVSDKLQDYLVTHHDLPPDAASDLVLQSRERATLGLLGGQSDEPSVESLARQLQENNRLTPGIILRAACVGDIDFLVASLAVSTGVPFQNAYQLIFDKGTLGLQAIYGRSSLPENLYPAIRIAIDVASETDYDGNALDQERYSRRIIERILTQYEDLQGDDIEYLLGKLSKLDAVGATRDGPTLQ